MEKSTRKKVIAITAVLLVAGGITGYFLWKRNKDKKDAEAALLLNPNADTTTTTNYGSGTTTSGGGSGTSSGGNLNTNTVGSGILSLGGSDLQKSFGDVKKFFLPPGQSWTKDPFSVELTINGIRRKFDFYSNGRYFGFSISNDGTKWVQIQSGNYSHGGKHITVTSGRNAGKGFQKATPTEAIKGAMNL